MIISIHQPNFLPWLGYFHKIVSSDIFVLFDDVQFPRSKSYGKRAIIKTQDGEMPITVPVLSKGDLKKYNEVQILKSNWRKKTLRTIQFAYQKAPFFQKYASEFSEVYLEENESLCDYNCELIRFILRQMDVQTKLILSSELCKNTEVKGEEKILFILKSLGATAYISGTGSGSRRYINEEHFRKENIELVWQVFKHPIYPQVHGEFIPNLSIIDLLFNCGKNSKNVLLGQSCS